MRNLTAVTADNRIEYVHCVADDSRLYTFEVLEGKLAKSFKAHDKDVIGVAVHPHRNLVATWADASELKLWRREY